MENKPIRWFDIICACMCAINIDIGIKAIAASIINWFSC